MGAAPTVVDVLMVSGSESVAHFALGDATWVSQSHGIHVYRPGETRTFWVDPAGCLFFDPDSRSAAA